MCLSIPALIITVDDDYGLVQFGDNQFRAGLHLIENPLPGDYVLIHAGFAIQKVDMDEAEATLSLFQELEATKYSRGGENGSPG